MAKTNIFTRLMSVLLLVAMLAGLMPAITRSMTANISAADTTWDVDGDGTLSILCIGNSFSRDAMQYVYQIADNLGITKIHLGNLFIGSCTLATHWTNASGDLAKYTYYKNTGGSWSSTGSYKMSTALTSRSWDYVSMQQASPNSGQASTYNSDLTNLVSYVKGKCPNSKLVWHMTWAYQANSTKAEFANYGKNQTTMYNAIVSATQSKIVTNSDFSIVVPSGTAIQNARTSLIKDNLCRDGYHLNTNIGRYIAGLTFVKAVTGLDISAVSFRATNVPDGYRAIAVESADNAVTTPYSVTTSAYTDPAASPASDYYTTRTLTLKANSYWNASNTTYYNKQYVPASTHSNYQKFYSTQRFNQYTLPIGSVIKLSSGWQYRPEAWLTDAVQASRPGMTTASYTVCSDEWWKNAANKYYLYRAFNIAKTSGTYGSATASTINGIFKIYVPKEYVTTDLSPDALYTQISSLADPIPNNSRVTWANASKLQSSFDWTKQYIIVSQSTTTNNKYYAMDPTTPRLFGTVHAVQVSVSSKSGTQRVYGADTDWAFKIQNRGTAYTTVSTSANTYRSAFRILAMSSPQTFTGTYDGNYLCYHNSRWEMYNSAAFGDDAYGTGIRPDLFFNTDDGKDRFHFYLESQYSSSYRSEFKDPGTDDPYFCMGSTKLGNSDSYACFWLFVIDTNKANTEALYSKLKEVQKYILVDHTYYESEYATFLSALQSAYSVYGSANGNTYDQTAVNNAWTALTNAANTLNAYNQIESMSIPYNKKIDGDAKVGTAGALEGTYFIDRLYNGNIAAVHSFMDTSVYKDTNANGNADSYGIVRMNVGTNGVIANDLTHAITLRHVTGTTNGYTMQFENRNFLARTGSSWRLDYLTNPQTWYFKDATYPSIADLVEIFDYSQSYLLYCDAGTSYFWRLHTKTDKESSEVLYTKRPERFGFRLFQLSPATLELYRALQFIQPYCDQNEAIMRYPSDLYKEFLADVKSAMSSYTTYNNNTYFTNTSAKTTCENWAKTLRAWADTLSQADSTLSYIDIPVEVFDFKADGVMFEYDDGYYGLGGNGSVSTALPGTLWYYNNGALSTTDNGGISFRRGLTETKLVNGHLVYKLQTIENTAQKILADDTTRGTSSKFLDSDGAAYNKEFFDRIGKITTLGTWEETRAKIEGQYNGGDLDWNEVETAFDMAYYVLTYLWREVPQTDANKLSLSNGDTYNMKVPEREILRLYKEEDSGLYTFYSDNNMAYNGYYMYNTHPTIPNPAINNYADFTPVNGIGFEANGTETDASRYYAKHGWVDKYETDNYHFVVHAYGSFVYYEDQDLYFQFVGDDDVYFYINNELAMDLGSAHSAVGDTLHLKNFTMLDGSKLVDGEVYTFDMYYAERHTHASNMKLNTNIKIVDTDTLTTKGQYVEISGDTDMVNSDTGMGEELVDNGLVRVGDTVAYSFDITNSHDVAIYDLIFEDKTLGTYISKDIIALSNEELTFTPTDITDIEVYYRTSTKDDNDNITVNTDKPVSKTLAQIKDMINTANTATETSPGTSLPEGSYRVTMASEQDLMELMALGVPANCQISVYGFKRYMTQEDENTTITNDLSMTCSYLPWGSNDTELNVRTLTGTASRILKVAALSGIPGATKAEYVIDYGKPLGIDITGAISNATGVTNDGFVGFTGSGYNGEFLKSAPSDLADVVRTDNGIFEHRLGKVYYSMSGMLSEVETVYAVFALSGCEIYDGAKARNYPYILSEITIVPATTMYYETDFDKISFVGDDSAYSMIDFNSNDTTVWGTKTPNNMTGAKVDGVLRGTVTGTDPYIVMDYTTGSALSHKVTSTDVVKVRIKSDPCIGDGLQVFFMTDTNENPVGGISTDIAPYEPNKQWQIITLPILSGVVGKTIKGIRLDPIGNNNSFQSSGSFEYDWIYIGPDVDDSSMFAYDSAKTGMFKTHTTSTENTWQTIGTSHTTLQTPTFASDADTYGYEAAYDNEAILSNNSSMFVIGAGVPRFNTDYTPNYAATANYTETSFRFTGTGFDIISRTGEQQGALRAMIYTEDGDYVKAISVINTGVLELYQIPVISVRDLDYGAYQVKIFVNAPYTNTAIPALNRGGEFYFDAVRIYNPLDVTSGTKESKLAYEIYLRHGEADHTVTEMHDILIEANSFTAGSAMNGVAYIDANAVAKNEVDLRFIDDENYDLVRKQETNLGDFAADALRYVFGQEGKQVDAAIVLGEDIRSNLYLGDVYQTNCQAVHPNGNLACSREVTGQQLLDALEWSARWAGLTPTKFFLQVSGMSYTIDRSIPSTVQKDANNNWCGAPTGAYRVKNVMIGGKPLDPDAVYLIAGYSNILRNCENGFAMFSDAGEVHLQPMRDSYVLESYIKSFPALGGVPTIQATNSVLGANYSSMNGEGRITLIGNDSADPSQGDAIAPTPVVIDKAPEIKNYMHLGPNQEVYLNPNAGIAFKIEATGTLPSRIDIAARSADGKDVVLAVSISNTPPTDLQNAFGVKIISCTAQYYGLGLTESDWTEDADGKKYAYAAICNNGNGILSITDIKYAYNVTDPAVRSRSAGRYLSFLVDEAMLDAYGVCVEHDLTYVDMADLHEASCTKCAFTEIIEHTFVDGACICGASTSTAPVVDKNLQFSMDITAGAEIGVNYSVSALALSGYTDFRLEVVKDIADSDPITTVYGKDGIDFTALTHPLTGEALMYNAKYEGINAKEMGDNFATTLYAVDADGNVYRSETVISSIKDYLISKIDAPDASDEAKTLAVDMLKYGAAAQVYFDYDTENPVTADLSEEQLSHATKDAPKATDRYAVSGNGAGVSTNITVGSKVELGLSCIASVIDPSAVHCVITDADGKILADLATVAIGGVMHSAKYDNVGAKQMREVITATFYDGEKAISQTVNWSVESYVAQTLAKPDVSAEQADMVNAMLTYGDAIAAYLSATGQ